MHKKLVFNILLVLGFLICVPVNAVVGFVPNGGLWFSKTDLKPGEPVTVFTVVVNNEYALISGAVTFYDNNDPIGTMPIKVVKDQAAVAKVTWRPKDGAHGVYAKLAGSAQEELNGPTIALPTTDQNSTLASIFTTHFSQPLSEAVDVIVHSNESGSILTIGGGTSAVAGEKISFTTSTTPAPTTSTVDEIFLKNKTLLDNAGKVIATITTTASSVAGVYAQGKEFVSTSEAYYAKAQHIWQQIQPTIARAAPVWDVLSNHNDPKRILIIVVVFLIILAILRRM